MALVFLFSLWFILCLRAWNDTDSFQKFQLSAIDPDGESIRVID